MRALAALLVCLVPLIAAAQVPLPGKVQNQDRTFTPGADLSTIRQRGWIEFGVYGDFRPYSRIQDGQPVGTDIELGRIIAAELGGPGAVSGDHSRRNSR